MSAGSRRVLSVSQINELSRELLEQQFATVWVEGEISNLAMPSSGHWYFTLKDERAQLRCAMFRNRNFRVRQRPENGQQVLLRGGISLYVARGDYQLIVDTLEDAGHGRLQREFEALRDRLADEGLFDSGRKRPMPASLHHVAVITSATGAAVRDFVTVFRRRFPATLLSVVPSAVQGAEAAAELRTRLAWVNARGPTLQPPVDVVVLTRGGGSLEDLWAFNDEALARAIAASTLPVVSAVGHETDLTIADLAADLRAPTPSAAAALLAPDGEALARHLVRDAARLQRAQRRRLDDLGRRLAGLRRRLRHPASLLREQAQRLDELDARMRRARERYAAAQQTRLAELRERLRRRRPDALLGRRREDLATLAGRSLRALLRQQQRRRQRLQGAVQLLQAVSPLATLGRGYAIVSGRDGRILRRAEQAAVGDVVQARLGAGRLECRVEGRLPDPDAQSNQ